MEINFGKDAITWGEDEEKTNILINEINPSQLINLLEKCVSSETNITFTESDDISPFSKKLKELIETAFAKSNT